MNLAEAHQFARIVNDDAMRLGCEPPLVVESYRDEHTVEVDGNRYVRYERARYRRAVARGGEPFDA